MQVYLLGNIIILLINFTIGNAPNVFWNADDIDVSLCPEPHIDNSQKLALSNDHNANSSSDFPGSKGLKFHT